MILDKIVEDKKERLEADKRAVPLESLKEAVKKIKEDKHDFYKALSGNDLSVIAEFKNASPSHGNMDNKLDLDKRISQYSKCANAISCLTEEKHFKGSKEYLMSIRKITDLPILRKDFIIDPYQVYEAKLIGADAILLIAAILDDRKFKELYDLAVSLNLDVLCEVHTLDELKRMLNLGVKIIGINNRNLYDFTIDLETTIKLSEYALDKKSKDTLLVTESGITKLSDIKHLRKSKVNALLVGTVLMESDNPEGLITDFKEEFRGE
ncbi:indole-3-glycerol phosphate synthase TrpC [Lachnospira multipara]|uniref:indole-3-glycerol phosphate synthase TrpC n=1 Tax=Lachnospira multipara TaxID=28051 RepID=UPI0004E27CAE|nr:indole-3-glycerol phosphate synthase TrpC [Lachnospira multipara]